MRVIDLYMKYVNLLLISLMLITHSGVLAASTSDNLLNLSLEDLMQVQVVSSTLTEKNLRTVPSSITVFTHEQIATMGIDSFEELLNFVPGFQSFRQAEAGNAYYHSARGRRTGDSSREVLVLVDGQRFQDEFFADAAIYNFPLNSIDKVEVIRGPGSAIYGSNAFTGVINITTRKNTNELSVNVADQNKTFGQFLYSQSVDDYRIDVDAHVFNDKGQNYQLENSVTHLLNASSDPSNGYAINAKVSGSHVKFSAMHYQQLAQDFYVAETSSNAENAYRKTYDSAKIITDLALSSTLKTQLDFEVSRNIQFFKTPIVPPTSSAELDERSMALNIQGDWNINEQHSMQFGMAKRNVDSDKTLLKTIYGPFLLSEAYTRDVTSFYIQDQSAIYKDTELTLGTRYDNYSNSGSALSPRLGITHQLSELQTIKLFYGQAFRAPAIGELILSNNNAVVGNLHLKPETIETWELVWMGNWKNHSITLTAFDSCIKNAIVQGFQWQVRQFVNAEALEKSQGVEIEYFAQLATNWQLRAEYSLFNKLPESSFRQADNLASVILNYQHDKWNFNLSANHAGEREMLSGTNKISLSSYWLANSKAQYALSDGINIYLQAKNMFNAKYLTPTQGSALTQGIPNRGREWSLGLNWSL